MKEITTETPGAGSRPVRRGRPAVRIKLISRPAVGRCGFCRAWFSAVERGLELRAGRRLLFLCARDAAALARRYRTEIEGIEAGEAINCAERTRGAQ
ncbi:MAG TPA: hypothetical protein VNN77_06265 [candidate division Zixibacteria bacterium]|nr:hypothetical protein [candidate division Zixibacteria bacterium]